MPYEGIGGGTVIFGYRLHPQVPEHDAEGFRNEAADIWYGDGYWLETHIAHPFDLLHSALFGAGSNSLQAHG